MITVRPRAFNGARPPFPPSRAARPCPAARPHATGQARISRAREQQVIYVGTLEILATAMSERGKRLEAMVAKVSPDDEDRARLREHIAELCRVLLTGPLATPSPEELFTVLAQAAASGTPYIAAVRNLSPNYVATSTAWLEEIVEELWTRSVALLPTLVLRSRLYGT